MAMKWTSYGPSAMLVQFADKIGDEAFARCRAIVAALETRPPQGLVEFVPAFTNVCLEFDPATVPSVETIAPEVIRQLEAATTIATPDSLPKEIPIVYDGPDLKRVAEHNGITVQEVCTLHAEAVYKVYMLGFSPGFPYLGGLDQRLHTPRLPSPRPRVPAGSVAIGGEHAGIYTVDSPGGWNIIGHTTARIFDLARAKLSQSDDAIFLLRPGDRVRFVMRETEKAEVFGLVD